MRSIDERINAVKNRTSELQQKQKIRRNRIVALSSVAACLAIVVGMGVAMPGIMKQMSSDKFAVMGDVGSVFSSGNAIGYVLIGIVAFCLGVCVTLFCVQLRKSSKEDHHNDRNN
ncbi:MAG: DUF4179 domain-containing protein [Oscillospiraceae bacterium]